MFLGKNFIFTSGSDLAPPFLIVDLWTPFWGKPEEALALEATSLILSSQIREGEIPSL